MRSESQRLDAGLRPIADAPSRGVDDAAQAHQIGGIGDDPQVGEQVTYLTPLVKPHAAHDAVGQSDPDEDLFKTREAALVR